jgi:XTP/dITP diphosphohydrolase
MTDKTDKIEIVLATRNKNKTKEIKGLLKNFPVIIKDFDDFGPLPEVVEDGKTFEENAYKKASFAARILGFPTMADDSGLCVKALNNAPGIFSARYAGENAKYKDLCAKLLFEMKDKKDREAYFKCVISIATPTGQALTYEAECKGLITENLKGENGFGYDPVFYYPELKKTFAQITMEEKAKVSHRGKALSDIKKEFDKILIWIKQNMPIYEKFKSNIKC